MGDVIDFQAKRDEKIIKEIFGNGIWNTLVSDTALGDITYTLELEDGVTLSGVVENTFMPPPEK